MPDCSDLKDKYDKAKDRAERMRDKANYEQDRFDDAEDDFDFESGRDCELHQIILPDGTIVPDTGAYEDCLKERARVDRTVAYPHFEMEVGPGRAPGVADLADFAVGAGGSYQA